MAIGLTELENELEELINSRAEAEGLTPAALQGIVDNLGSREDRLLYFVFRKLAEEYRKGVLPDAEVDEAAVQLGSDSATSRKEEKQLARLAAQHADVCGRIQPVKDAIDSVQAAAKLQIHLEKLQSLIETGCTLDAAQAIAEAVGEQSSNRGGEVLETQLLQELEKRGRDLAKDLSEDVARAYSCHNDENRCWLRVDTGINLEQTWEALRLLSEADQPLERCSARLVDHLLLPTAKSENGGAASVSKEGDNTTFVVEFGKGQSSEGVLMQIFSFISDTLFCGNAALNSSFGKAAWDPVAKLLIDNKLRPAVPQSDQEFLDFEMTSQPALDLEASVFHLGLLDSKQRPIQAFAEHAGDKWLQKKRLLLVSEARDLILHPDLDAVSVGLDLPLPSQSRLAAETGSGSTSRLEGSCDWGKEGEEAPLLAQGSFQISRTGERIVELLHRAVEEAVETSSPRIAQSTLLALRDIAALYSAIPPVVQQRELEVPQLAALHRNNCFHLAQQLLTLPHCYPELRRRHAVGGSLREEAMSLREAGRECLALLAQQQGKELREILAGADGFARVHKAQRGIKARKVIQQALHLLRRLGSVLGPVLPPAALVETGAAVIDAAADKVTEDLLSIVDISVEESEDLPKILEPFANESASAFVASEPESRLLSRAIEQSAAALQRLKAVVGILSARLVEIQEQGMKGEFKRMGLSAAEVLHLISALFEDTELRQEVISSFRAQEHA